MRTGRDTHFIGLQRSIWIPATAAASGMLGGAFTDLGHHRYLVTILWSDPAAHQRYASQDVPRLRARAALDNDNDVHTMTGHRLVLEPAWSVLPDA